MDLDLLVGEWRTEANPLDTVITGTTTFEWLEGGGYLIQRTSTEGIIPGGVMVIGPAAGDGRIVQHYFDSRGVARIYEMSLDDGVWKLWREPATADDFAQRFTGNFSADRRLILGTWEHTRDGDWAHDFDLKYSRAG